ncbi:hypothetical protein [Trichormus variabilis]|uniref:hypothetical protein n=1 Tax=Anabaena variabilis TaxID=264691 RepID=UPI000F8E30DE|nr:hypothetical protein [Trichormus variabilis]MBD2626379.1 hypothetical protein [Trichormus variabilis FACHB-164]
MRIVIGCDDHFFLHSVKNVANTPQTTPADNTELRQSRSGLSKTRKISTNDVKSNPASIQ